MMKFDDPSGTESVPDSKPERKPSKDSIPEYKIPEYKIQRIPKKPQDDEVRLDSERDE